MPLPGMGLWDAEIITPTRSTSTPFDAMPAAIAAASISPAM